MEPLYVFGYGSLIWRPGFTFQSKVNGYIVGFDRKFRQVSSVHRGTKEHPGRVATLLKKKNAIQPGQKPSSEDKVYGTAFCIPADQVTEVVASLDSREAGYDRVWTTVYIGDHIPAVRALVYVGCEENVSNVVCEREIACLIAQAKGKSGPNCDYLFRLRDIMREWNVLDDHLEILVRLVKQYQKEFGIKPNAISYRSQAKGTIVVHCSSAVSISNRGEPVYSCGIQKVVGSFQKGDIIEIQNKLGHSIAKGLSLYSSEQLDAITGQSFEQHAAPLPRQQQDCISSVEVICKKSMVLC